jgi:hypothetical protein
MTIELAPEEFEQVLIALNWYIDDRRSAQKWKGAAFTMPVAMKGCAPPRRPLTF